MEPIILRPNAIPVYGFLSQLNTHDNQQGKILDCGAGGPVPPLALFAQHGYACWGIDISAEQLSQASHFCQEHQLAINLQPGDMRALPFEDGFFDHVYEHYAMCHLNKKDTLKTIQEMYRVTKSGGFCFLGMISAETWPRSMFGEEKGPGEYWGEEGGERRMHSMFTQEEADQLVADWEVVKKEKQVHYFQSSDHKASPEEWMARLQEIDTGPSRDEWEAMYEENAGAFQYHHLYYTLRKS